MSHDHASRSPKLTTVDFEVLQTQHSDSTCAIQIPNKNAPLTKRSDDVSIIRVIGTMLSRDSTTSTQKAATKNETPPPRI